MKTIVPATATAKLSARLVPGQTPDGVAEKVRVTGGVEMGVGVVGGERGWVETRVACSGNW